MLTVVDDLFTAASEVEAACRAERLTHCFIGGIAVIRWGIPRVTRDLDVSVMAGFGGERAIVTALMRHFAERIAGAAGFAEANRVLLLKTAGGIEIDASLAALPFEEEMFRRASTFAPVAGVSLTTCSAEDLIVMKAFAARPRDWSDVEGVIKRQAGLDWTYVDAMIPPLAELKPEVDVLGTLARLRG
ncbi:MAG: hypothetical protein IT381_16810 [Deltaproteobacteria bacterium]|nr:hypothetical protein [Deltaproteobacteria bacterium]